MTMRKYIDILNEDNPYDTGIEPTMPDLGEPQELNAKDFPHVIKYEGENYYLTDKLGHNIQTGEPSAHYQTAPKYLWRTKSGQIDPD